MSAGLPTAAWSLPSLVNALGRGGWGALDGRAGQGVRSVMHALVALLPHKSAEGTLTAAQVADAAGLSLRWVRDRLQLLEAAGLVTWSRGFIDRGKPKPGRIRVNKRLLAQLVRDQRPAMDARRQLRREQFAERLKGIRNPHRVKYRPLSDRAELGSPLPPDGGGTYRRSAPRGGPMPDAATHPCPHGEPRGWRCCPLCRRNAAGRRLVEPPAEPTARRPLTPWRDLVRQYSQPAPETLPLDLEGNEDGPAQAHT